MLHVKSWHNTDAEESEMAYYLYDDFDEDQLLAIPTKQFTESMAHSSVILCRFSGHFYIVGFYFLNLSFFHGPVCLPEHSAPA